MHVQIIIDSFNNTINHKMIDFQLYEMAWWFYDFNDKYHTDYLRGDVNNIVRPSELICGARKIINDVMVELGLTIHGSPIVIRDHFQSIIDNNKQQLKAIIDNASTMYAIDDITNAWNCLMQSKYDHNLSNRMRELMKYVELAVFFYTVGIHNHNLKWHY